MDDPRNEAILTAAFTVFVAKGFHRATMLDIASCARVSKETLYDRFENKEGLFYALLAWGGRQAKLDPAYYEVRAKESPEDALREFIETSLSKMYQPQAIAISRIGFAEAPHNLAIARDFHDMVTANFVDVLPILLAALVECGAMRPVAIPDFADTLAGLMKGIRHQAVLLGAAEAPTEEEIAAHARVATRRALLIFSQ
jgi:AcrR family transcriptional regulator